MWSQQDQVALMEMTGVLTVSTCRYPSELQSNYNTIDVSITIPPNKLQFPVQAAKQQAMGAVKKLQKNFCGARNAAASTQSTVSRKPISDKVRPYRPGIVL
jgi:hypothetical protein